MNLNNWLCKHFDKEKKGYVTIGDVFTPIFMLLFLLGFVCSVLLGVGLFFADIQGYGVSENLDLKGTLILSLRGWIIPAVIIISTILISMLVIYVSSIKLAKCPLKEQKKDD